MIREIVGSRNMASIFMPKKRRKRRNMMSSMGTVGILAGAGIAYMAMRKNKDNADSNE